MAKIAWNTLISVGNPRIDAQHQRWVRIFNQLEESLGDLSSTTSDQTELLKEILDFTREHFIEEEKLMAQHGYPHVVRHRRLHKDFELQLFEKFRMVLAGEMVLQSELIAMIRHWFIAHTSSEDRQAFIYINSQGRKEEACTARHENS